jgi:hypothetical protein
MVSTAAEQIRPRDPAINEHRGGKLLTVDSQEKFTGGHPSSPRVDPEALDRTSQPDSPPIGFPG